MWLCLHLDGVDLYLRIQHYAATRNPSEDDWCGMELRLQSRWLDYEAPSPAVTCDEVDTLRDTLAEFLSDALREERRVEFLEPDLCFLLRPRSAGSPKRAELRLALWDDALTESYFSLHLNPANLERLLLYLRLTTGKLSPDSSEVAALLKQGILRPEYLA